MDDGSSDGTTNVIKGFGDKRIRYAPLGHNHGLAVAKRRAMELARGTYVAILNSDDTFLPDKLETQVLALEDHPDMGAVFTGVEVVDEAGNAFGQEDHPYFEVFKQANRSRPEWLRRFFYEGNCLCAPSVLMPRGRILEIGYLDKRFRQLADFDLWIRLCFKHPIYIISRCLTRFRVRDGAANASASTPETQVRDLWEYRQLLRQYSRISSEEELIRIFPEAAAYSDPEEPLDAGGIAYVVARLALDHGGQRWEHFALDTLFDLLADDRRAVRIQARFGFGYREFIELTGRCDVCGLL